MTPNVETDELQSIRFLPEGFSFRFARPESMPSSEITSYKPTRYRSGPCIALPQTYI